MHIQIGSTEFKTGGTHEHKERTRSWTSRLLIAEDANERKRYKIAFADWKAFKNAEVSFYNGGVALEEMALPYCFTSFYDFS